MTVPSLIDMLEKSVVDQPEKPALIYENETYVYREVYKKVNRFAWYLKDKGLQKGNHVGLMTRKTPDFMFAFLGIMAAGGVPFPLDFNQTAPFFEHLFQITQPFTIIVHEDFKKQIEPVRLNFPSERVIYLSSDSVRQWDDLFPTNPHDPSIRPSIRIDADDPAYLNLTSGTTGHPKCAVTTHAHIYWNTRSSVEALKLRPDDIHLCMFAVFAHPHEIFARPLYLGGTIVLVDKVSPKTIVKSIQDNNVTCMMSIASVYETMVRLYDKTPFNVDSLRLPESGGMHTSPTLAKEFLKFFGRPIIPVWGSTEASGIGIASAPDQLVKLGSVGKPCPYYEFKIVDDAGKEVGTNETGVLAMKGPGVINEYLKNPVETQKQIRDGWFYTGDMMKKDEDGYYFVMGRQNGMMKVAGLKVFPVEIEDVLTQHPKIKENAVVKTLDPLHGEIPRAVVVLEDNASMDIKEIRQYCEIHLPRYKVPRIIEFRDKLPRTPGGKILWREL